MLTMKGGGKMKHLKKVIYTFKRYEEQENGEYVLVTNYRVAEHSNGYTYIKYPNTDKVVKIPATIEELFAVQLINGKIIKAEY